MYIGTCDGLNFFNSRDVTSYQPKNEQNFLSGNVIDRIIYTGNNIFWIQTYYGLNKYDANTNTVSHFNDFQKLYFIDKSQNNNLFIVKESNSIYYYHSSTDTFKKIQLSGFIFSDLSNVFIDNNNILWILTNKGYNLNYHIVENKGEDNISVTPLQNNNINTNILQSYYVDNELYIIDKKYNLYSFDLLTKNEKFIFDLKSEIQKRGKVSSITSLKGNIFIGFMTNGLIQLKKEQGLYTKNDIGINSGIFCLKKDIKQDLIWIGTDGKGVYTYSNTLISIKSYVLSNLAYNIECPVRAIFLDKSNSLWIGSKGDGILKIHNYNVNKNLNDCEVELINKSNNAINDNVIYAFGKSKKNILWIGGEDGLYYYSYKTKKINKININIDGQKSRILHSYEGYQYMEESQANANTFRYIHDIFETSDSKLWISSVGLGIICADIKGSEDSPVLTNIKHYTINNGDFESNYFFSIYAENDTSIWFANRGYGAFHFNNQTRNLDPINHHSNQTNQTINDVFAIRKDKNGNIIIGTGYGLLKYSSPETTKIFNTESGFLNNSIHAIQEDEDDTFWLTTNRGIIHFDNRNETFRIYDNPDGLFVTEFSDGASYKDKESGLLFFGGINGFVTIQKDTTDEQKYMPDIFFDQLTIFGEKINIYEKLRKNKKNSILELSFKQNFFTLSFTAIDYVNGANYNYFYKISELSDQWIDNGSNNNASFTNISPGTYTLKVKYYNRTLNKESDEYVLKIHINPPWFLSIWAYVFYWLSGIFIVFLILNYYSQRQSKKKQALIDEWEQKHQKEIFESKLQFFTSIAHEFCTPLTLISGPCERILSQSGITKFVSNYIKMIKSNAERLNDLILELIEFRRIETGNRELFIESINVEELTNSILERFEDLRKTNAINLQSQLPTNLIWNSDKGFLSTILTNLLSNAFKYTQNGKCIVVSIQNAENQLTIKVANEGKPIKESNFSRIFDRYTILDDFENKENIEAFSRNGLGLAILNNMINLLNGTISVSNTPDGFILFTVNLPALEATYENKERTSNIPQYTPRHVTHHTLSLPNFSVDHSKPTMLIIDDDIEFLWLTSEMFSDEFNIKALDDPTQIDDILIETRPNIILSDIMMPGFSGIELTKKIKSNPVITHIPIVIISGNYGVEKQIQAMEAGAEMYINKPFDVQFLKISVKQILERKENLKDYYNSPISSFELVDGKITHKDDKKFLQKIIKIINNNLANKDLSAQFIADKLGIGYRSLYRKLEDMGEKNLVELIRDCRLHVACNLLINSKFTIEEIAYKSGYSSKVNFYKVFNKKHGCTPKEYRDQFEKNISKG
ncbi:response regulator [Paludibacter sp.]